MKKEKKQSVVCPCERQDVGYIRVSTIQQEEGMSFEVQTQQIAAGAAINQDTITQWFQDTDSGGRDDREQFFKLREAARRGEIRKVYVYSLDRFARDLLISESTYQELLNQGVKIVSIREHLVEGPFGNLMRQITAAFAEYEKAVITMRLHQGRNHKVMTYGTHQGGRVFGYRKDPNKKGGLIIHEEEAKVVRLIFSIREQGFSGDAIANYLNDKGYTTSQGCVFRHNAVKRIIANEAFYRAEKPIAEKIEAQQVAHAAILPPREPGAADLAIRIPYVHAKGKVYDDNGGYQGRSPHLGRHFVNKDILEAARIIFEMRANGDMVKDIAAKLNELGLKPCNRETHSADTVRVFLKNKEAWKEQLENHGFDLDEAVWSYRKPHPRDMSITEHEIYMVRKARELYATRKLTLEEIAEKLNGMGFRNTVGGKLTKVQVHRMLEGEGRYQRLPDELVATQEELAESPLEASLAELKNKTSQRRKRPPKPRLGEAA